MTFERDKYPASFAFELSNRCNYSQFHPECPTDARADPIFLNTDIVKDTIKYFGSVNYNGTFYFNIYNEPLIDPRLFMLLEYNKQHSGCGVCLFTNGWNLNAYMVQELFKLNVSLTVSRYTDREEARLVKLEGTIGSRIVLDPKVKTIYDSPPTRSGPCHFPSIYGMINYRGEFVVCCRDFEYRHIIADLNHVSVEEALLSEYRQEVCDRLEAGDRFLDACKRCPYPGWGIENGPYGN
jgi:hypothetical protein